MILSYFSPSQLYLLTPETKVTSNSNSNITTNITISIISFLLMKTVVICINLFVGIRKMTCTDIFDKFVMKKSY